MQHSRQRRGCSVLRMLLGDIACKCGHRNVGWPLHNWQRCLECGSRRFYDLQHGVRGEWMGPELPYSEVQLIPKSAVVTQQDVNIFSAQNYLIQSIHFTNGVNRSKAGICGKGATLTPQASSM